MLMDGQHFMDYATSLGGSGRPGTASGAMIDSMGAMMAGGMLTNVNWGYFDFSDNKAYTGQAKGLGWGGKIGMSYKLSPELSLGASYHLKTRFADLKTNKATMTMSVETPGGTMVMPVSGKLSVVDFSWPAMYGVGFSYTPNDTWQFVGDYRMIGWKDSMENFKMSFTSTDATYFSGQDMNLSMKQNWKNQHVLMLGAAYRYNSQLTLRGGINIANNPVPNNTVHPLFPAIVRNHLTGGFGYLLDKSHSFDFSMTYAPKVSVTAEGYNNVTISHSQVNAQLMYSWRF